MRSYRRHPRALIAAVAGMIVGACATAGAVLLALIATGLAMPPAADELTARNAATTCQPPAAETVLIAEKAP